MAASIKAVEQHEVEISAHQTGILDTGHDMLLLYSSSSALVILRFARTS